MMSNNDEKGFLNNVFRDFEAVPDASTKEEVMKHLPEKRRRKRLFLFLFTGFILAASFFSYRWYNNHSNQKQDIAKISSSNKINESSNDSYLTQNSESHEKLNHSDATTEKEQQKRAEQKVVNPQNSTEKETTNNSQTTSTSKNKSKQLTGPGSKSKTPPVRKHDEQKDAKDHLEVVNKTSSNKKSQKFDDLHEIPGKKANIIQMNLHSEIIELPKRKNSFKNNGKWAWGFSFSQIWCIDCETNTQLLSLENADNSSFESQNSDPALSLSSGENNKFKINSQTTFSFSLVRYFKQGFYLKSGAELSKLNISSPDFDYGYYSGGIPLSLGYSLPLRSRWNLQIETGINNHWTFAQKTNDYSWLDNGFYSNILHLQVGAQYMLNEKISFNLAPETRYLLYSGNSYVQEMSNRKLWLGFNMGVLVRL